VRRERRTKLDGFRGGLRSDPPWLWRHFLCEISDLTFAYIVGASEGAAIMPATASEGKLGRLSRGALFDLANGPNIRKGVWRADSRLW
jgi:hypothetical protein